MYVYKYVSQCRNRAGRLASLRIVQARSSLPEVDAGKLGLPASCTPAPPKGVSATVFSPQKWLKCVKPYLTFSQPSTGFTSENREKGVASSLRSVAVCPCIPWILSSHAKNRRSISLLVFITRVNGDSLCLEFSREGYLNSLTNIFREMFDEYLYVFSERWSCIRLNCWVL